jgi:hypothetical protein
MSCLAMAELGRCLHRLVALFPDPDFIAHPPKIVLERYPALSEEPVERDACIALSRRDLGGSPEEILTILLHKTVHAFHAFLWQRDCTRWSYHTQAFRRLAKHVGFHVGWAGRRYGWAQTRPSRSLACLFEEIALSAQTCEPFRHDVRRQPSWHCGQLCFPSRADLVGRLESSDSRRLVRSLQVHGRGDSPMVRLSGRWLSSFGFARGARLKVEAHAGRLVIEARPDPETWR